MNINEDVMKQRYSNDTVRYVIQFAVKGFYYLPPRYGMNEMRNIFDALARV